MKQKKTLKLLNIVFSSIIGLSFAVILFFAYQYLLAYPTPFKGQILAYSKEYSLNPCLVYAVIKTESSFNKKAVSNKGAKGLMQITDGTGEYIANKIGVESYNLLNENDNIRFGCYYLRYLINKFKSVNTALAAYNAGEGRVASWLKNSAYCQDGINLTTIPYIETAEYIKKITKTLNKYQKLYGNIVDKSVKKK